MLSCTKLNYLKSNIVVRSVAVLNDIPFFLFHFYSLLGHPQSIYKQKQDFLASQYDLVSEKHCHFFLLTLPANKYAQIKIHIQCLADALHQSIEIK